MFDYKNEIIIITNEKGGELKLGLKANSQSVTCPNCGKVIKYVMNRPYNCYYCRTEFR